MDGATTKVEVMGFLQLNDNPDLLLRFVLEQDGRWTADLVIDTRDNEVYLPPDCFRPTQEVIGQLDAGLDGLVAERKARLEREWDEMEEAALDMVAESPDPGWMND